MSNLMQMKFLSRIADRTCIFSKRQSLLRILFLCWGSALVLKDIKETCHVSSLSWSVYKACDQEQLSDKVIQDHDWGSGRGKELGNLHEQRGLGKGFHRWGEKAFQVVEQETGAYLEHSFLYTLESSENSKDSKRTDTLCRKASCHWGTLKCNFICRIKTSGFYKKGTADMIECKRWSFLVTVLGDGLKVT